MRARRSRQPFPAAALSLLLALRAPVLAQDPDRLLPDIAESPTIRNVSDTSKSDAWTLGDRLLPYDGDPLALDSPALYIDRPALIGTDPSFGWSAERAEKGCAAQVDPVVPVKLDPAFPRYLSYRSRTRLPIGVSADAGCHLDLPATVCNFANHQTTLETARASGLDKIRLWVALAGENVPNNVPFLECPSASASPDCALAPAGAGPFWRLDKPNRTYFSRLRQVVAFAQRNDVLVEVTFFAPFEGDFFGAGPWGGRGRLPNADGQLETVRFSLPEYGVVDDARDTAEARMNLRMREAQRNVIAWTVQELWCFDNVWWEIANEPEAETVDPLAVAAWQKEMIRVAMAEEAKVPQLAPGGHLIAVQPSTLLGASQVAADPNVDILNGHYTTIATASRSTPPDAARRPLDAGALTLIQTYGSRQRPFGFNETKITPLGGKAGTRAHVDGQLESGRPEPARAEAWEFAFDQGGIYDHWGYLSGGSPTAPADIRRQLGVLVSFLHDLIAQGSNLTPTRAPAWIAMDPYPTGTPSGLDPARTSHRYWAALETSPTAARRLFLLYLHHSTPRCQASRDPGAPEVEFSRIGCPKDADDQPIFLARNSYDARVWTSASTMYQTDLTLLDLGPADGTFDVQWITPATGAVAAAQTIQWDGAGKTCNGGACAVRSPRFPYDIVLRLQER